MARPTTILLIDGSADDRAAAVRALRDGLGGAVAAEAADEAALEHALAGDPPDAAVTERGIGRLGGTGVIRRLKSRWPEVPVLVLTGAEDAHGADAAMAAGADDYLLKRCHGCSRLPSAVSAALARAELRREGQRARERYRDLFVSIPVGLGLIRGGEILEANDALLACLAGPRSAADGARELARRFISEHAKEWQEAMAGGAPEVRVNRPDGTSAWAVMRARAVPGYGGQLHEFVLTDISHYRAAQEEKAVLLGELYHRVNNNLQTLIGFVAGLAARSQEPATRQGLDDLISRIHSISLVQSRLYRSGDYARVNFREFLEELLASMSGHAAGTARLADVTVPVSRAIPLGMMANELLLSASRGTPQGADGGAVSVSLVRDGGSAVLTIVDPGRAEAGAETAPSAAFGARLLRSLVRQADAEMLVSQAAGGGTRVDVRFPA